MGACGLVFGLERIKQELTLAGSFRSLAGEETSLRMTTFHLRSFTAKPTPPRSWERAKVVAISGVGAICGPKRHLFLFCPAPDDVFSHVRASERR